VALGTQVALPLSQVLTAANGEAGELEVRAAVQEMLPKVVNVV